MIRRAALVAALGALFAAPYLVGEAWWRYLAADAGLFAVAGLAWGRRAPATLGLRIPPRHAALAAALLALSLAGALAVVAGLEAAGEVAIRRDPALRWKVFGASQVLHQEVVLRALVLGGLRRWIEHDLAASCTVAFAFVGIHAAFFAWAEGVVLPPTTLATLLAFALAGNELYLGTGHVAFSFALHAGWNLARFGASYRALPSGRYLGEGESFAAVEGEPAVLAGALLLLALCAAAVRLGRGRGRGDAAGVRAA